MDEYVIKVRIGNLPGSGYSYQARFTPGEGVTLTLDARGVPDEKMCEFIGDGLTALRGVVLARLRP
jgi:hypothetical protein